MTISRLWPVVLLGALTAIRSATAQTAGNLPARGGRAYQNLDYPAEAGRTLYEGPIGDSLDVRWDGRDSLSAPISGGHYLLKVVAREPSGRIHRSLEVPLEVTRQAQDTLPIPPAPDRRQILPERAGGAPPLAGLGRALVLVAAVVALPVGVGAESDAGDGPLLVAGPGGPSGLIG